MRAVFLLLEFIIYFALQGKIPYKFVMHITFKRQCFKILNAIKNQTELILIDTKIQNITAMPEKHCRTQLTAMFCIIRLG